MIFYVYLLKLWFHCVSTTNEFKLTISLSFILFLLVEAEERGDLVLKRTKDLGKTFTIIHEDIFGFGYIGAFLFFSVMEDPVRWGCIKLSFSTKIIKISFPIHFIWHPVLLPGVSPCHVLFIRPRGHLQSGSSAFCIYRAGEKNRNIWICCFGMLQSGDFDW